MKNSKFFKSSFTLGNSMPNDVSNRKVHTLKLLKPQCQLMPHLETDSFLAIFIDQIPSTAKPKKIWLEIDSDEKMKKIRFLKIFIKLGWGMPNDVPNHEVHTWKRLKHSKSGKSNIN